MVCIVEVVTQQLLMWRWLDLRRLMMLTWQAVQQEVLTQRLLTWLALLEVVSWLPRLLLARGLQHLALAINWAAAPVEKALAALLRGWIAALLRGCLQRLRWVTGLSALEKGMVLNLKPVALVMAMSLPALWSVLGLRV
jgi:hypothetical protein